MYNKFLIKKQIIIAGILLFLMLLSFLNNIDSENMIFQRNILLIVILIFLSFICLLLFHILGIKRSEKNLFDKNYKLLKAYEKLKLQYNELLNNYEISLKKETELVHQIYYDTLTGLPNKLSLLENSKDIFIESDGTKSALLFIDLDHFKYINDTMGHAFGDRLLIKVSERLRLLLKSNCLLYRVGGDEFVIIVKNINGEEDAEVFAAHILAGFKEVFIVLNVALRTSLSIGIAIYPDQGNSIEKLLIYSDIAMYRAKESGRKCYVVYNKLMNEALIERIKIEKHLHNALGNNEFQLYYQPQLDLRENKIAGFEALLRWKSSELGFVSPMKFIEVAEETKLIIPLGTWVLKNACAFLNKLHKMGHTDLSMSVNISVLQLLQKDFIDIVSDTLSFFDLKPEYLELEITESILIQSFDLVEIKLRKLNDMGIRIALDDFGKGYSSLNYLRQLPISTLKIDKSFIDNVCQENEGDLTGHIINIGKSFGMCIVAEGVEKKEQLEFLMKHSCNKMQGYLFCKPICEEELFTLLEESNEISVYSNVN